MSSGTLNPLTRELDGHSGVRTAPPRALFSRVRPSHSLPMTDYFTWLKRHVIDAGICTHCGTCVGLFPDHLRQSETSNGPIPVTRRGEPIHDRLVYDVCPAREVKYQELNRFVFGKELREFSLGNYRRGYVGFAANEDVRRKAASGGIITATLLYLLRNKLIDGAVVTHQGTPKPWLAQPIIATTPAQIHASAQSIYVPTMTNAILAKISAFDGRLAFVGLPDQVAAIRELQRRGHRDAEKIAVIIGPYTGTAMYLGAVESFLRSNKVHSIDAVQVLRYRHGEWPGHLHIELDDGRCLRIPKFHYNYLIPFYITTSSLLSVDFANELTDISVGDAWSPRYEGQGRGFSAVLARTQAGLDVLTRMEKEGVVSLEPKEHVELVRMHAHMIDFKKRGAFIRLKWMRMLGRRTPRFDYAPKRISPSRYAVEFVIASVFLLARRKTSRWLVERIPIRIVGAVFDAVRKAWKTASKPTKRHDILDMEFDTSQ